MTDFHAFTPDVEAINRLLDTCRRRHFPPKTAVINPGDPATSMYYVIEGSLTVTASSPSSNELIIAYLNPGDFIGEAGLFIKPRPREMTVKTRTACELAEIEYDRLRELLHGELRDCGLEIMEAIASKLTQRLLKTTRKACDLVFVDAQGRVAKALIDMANEPGANAHPEGVQIRITRQELGRLVGCTREVAGRAVKALEEDGMIRVSGSRIVLLGIRKGAV